MTVRSGRTSTLLLGIGAVGALIWMATRVGGSSTSGYWAMLGVLGGAGLVFALSQRVAYGTWGEVAPLGFLVALIVAVVCVGWIAVIGEPHANWFRDNFLSWSHDMGIRGFVDNMTRYVSVIAFGFGALLASAPGAVGRTHPVHAASAVGQPAPPPVDPAAVEGNGSGVRTPERTRVWALTRGFGPRV